MDVQEQINELKAELDKLRNSTTIPLEVGEAMRERLQSAKVTTNGTAASTETVSINEAGVAVKTASKPMDGFITVVVNGLSKKVPYYD